MKLGATFSIGGPLTLKMRKTVEVERIPLQFIMSETDTFLAQEAIKHNLEHICEKNSLLKRHQV